MVLNFGHILSLNYFIQVLPHLEYAIPVWCPYLQKDKRIIKNVQRRATRAIYCLKI